jgi:hypothetical protein
LAKSVLAGFAEIFAPSLVQKVSYRVKIAYRLRPEKLKHFLQNGHTFLAERLDSAYLLSKIGGWLNEGDCATRASKHLWGFAS